MKQYDKIFNEQTGEYNCSQGTEFDHLDLWSTSALASQASKSISGKCVFCFGQYWSDKCDVTTDTEARKIYLRKFILRFRSHFVALVSDIEKAFHQISIIPEHRNYLRFLWVDDVFKNSPSTVKLRLARVVFSVTSSYFSLNELCESMY